MESTKKPKKEQVEGEEYERFFKEDHFKTFLYRAGFLCKQKEVPERLNQELARLCKALVKRAFLCSEEKKSKCLRASDAQYAIAATPEIPRGSY